MALGSTQPLTETSTRNLSEGQRAVGRPTTWALEPSQPNIQWVTGAHSSGVNQSGSEANHSPPSNAEVKNACSYTLTPPYVSME
jgi:hypothetical protein